jgi:hypothetical protein
MSIMVYDVNTFLKADSALQTIAGKSVASPMDMYPLIGYGVDDPNYPVPFIVYYWEPFNKGVEQYWNRADVLRYNIYDSDADRCFLLANRIIKLLGEGDSVSKSGGITSADNRILSSQLLTSFSEEPVEKEGWYAIVLSFEVMYNVL